MSGPAPTPPGVPPLPNRRRHASAELRWQHRAYQVSLGYHPETARLAEVFIRGAKHGSDLDAIWDDIAVVLSKALQAGLTPAEIARSLGRVPSPGDALGRATQPASPIGALVDLVAAEEAACRALLGLAQARPEGNA